MFEQYIKDSGNYITRIEHNIDGWIVYEFIYRNGLKSAGVYFHSACMTRVATARKSKDYRRFCPKCDITMPFETADKIENLFSAFFKRLPTP